MTNSPLKPHLHRNHHDEQSAKTSFTQVIMTNSPLKPHLHRNHHDEQSAKTSFTQEP